MKTLRISHLLGLATLGLVLGFSQPAFASDSLVNDAHDLLDKAAHPSDGATLSDEDMTKLLRSALEILQHIPAGTYGGHLQKAKSFINLALFEIKRGDPDRKVQDDIRQAMEQVECMPAN